MLRMAGERLTAGNFSPKAGWAGHEGHPDNLRGFVDLLPHPLG